MGPASTLAMDLAALARDALLEHPAAVEVPAPVPEEWRSLLGLYTDPEYHWIYRLEWRDGKLTWLDPNEPEWRPTLEPTGQPDGFVFSRGFRESGDPCVFLRRADGRVRGVSIADAETLTRLDLVEGE
jgi:hypothetical protein